MHITPGDHTLVSRMPVAPIPCRLACPSLSWCCKYYAPSQLFPSLDAPAFCERRISANMRPFVKFLFLWCALSAANAFPAEELNVLFLGDNGPHHPRERFASLSRCCARVELCLTYTDKVSDVNRVKLEHYDALCFMRTSSASIQPRNVHFWTMCLAGEALCRSTVRLTASRIRMSASS